MTVNIVLTTIGANISHLDVLYSSDGINYTLLHSSVAKSNFAPPTGLNVTVPAGTIYIRVQSSLGVCDESIDLVIVQCTTTSTTTLAGTTTTTTTVAIPTTTTTTTAGDGPTTTTTTTLEQPPTTTTTTTAEEVPPTTTTTTTEEVIPPTTTTTTTIECRSYEVYIHQDDLTASDDGKVYLDMELGIPCGDPSDYLMNEFDAPGTYIGCATGCALYILIDTSRSLLDSSHWNFLGLCGETTTTTTTTIGD